MSHATPRPLRLAPLAAAAVALLVAPAAPPSARAGEGQRVQRPLYAATAAGFEHFVQDQLPGLVAGQRWTWRGDDYEIVRLHRVTRAELVNERRRDRDYDPGTRGWVVATVHVKVNGTLRRARIVGNAGHSPDPAGWHWQEVLLYLGVGDHWDCVSREVV